MKHRLEDLGRIAEKLDRILDRDLFDCSKRPRRPKHVDEWLEEKNEDQLHETLSSIFFDIEEVERELYECSRLADGVEKD